MRRRAGARRRGAGACARAGRSTRRRSARSPTRGGCACSTARSWSATCRSTALVDECPVYDLEPLAAGARRSTRRRRRRSPTTPTRARTLLALLGAAPTSPRAAGRSSSTTASSARAPCAVPSRPTPPCSCSTTTGAARPAIAVSIDGNGRRVACDPYRGAVEAVLECAANLACVGAEPLGLTNCLNFGNPEKPHIAWQLTRAVAGLGDACRALGVPVVGGNVSLYNEGGGGPDLPDAGGRHGRRAARRRARRAAWASPQPGDAVALIAAALVGAVAGRRPSWPSCAARRRPASCRRADLGELRALHAAVRQAVRSGALRSAHDVAEGGLAVALAECCLAGGLGAGSTSTGSARRGAAVRRGPGRVRRLRPGRGAARVRRARARARRGRRRRARARRRVERPAGRAGRRARGRARGPPRLTDGARAGTEVGPDAHESHRLADPARPRRRSPTPTRSATRRLAARAAAPARAGTHRRSATGSPGQLAGRRLPDHGQRRARSYCAARRAVVVASDLRSARAPREAPPSSSRRPHGSAAAATLRGTPARAASASTPAPRLPQRASHAEHRRAAMLAAFALRGSRRGATLLAGLRELVLARAIRAPPSALDAGRRRARATPAQAPLDRTRAGVTTPRTPDARGRRPAR